MAKAGTVHFLSGFVLAQMTLCQDHDWPSGHKQSLWEFKLPVFLHKKGIEWTNYAFFQWPWIAQTTLGQNHNHANPLVISNLLCEKGMVHTVRI